MSIPTNANKVFSGKLFDVYQWEQELFDGSFETFEKIKWPETVEIVTILEDWKLWMTLEEQPGRKPFYSLVAWRIEPGEEPIEWAKRELFEETGLRSDEWEYIKTYTISHKVVRPAHLYIARNCRKDGQQCLDAGEKIEFFSLDLDEFISKMADEKFRNKEFALDVFRLYYIDGVDAVKKFLNI